ncbi:low molecular weight protein tyrosine phosphatase family protein [Pontibacter harenae]|uniref:low molecular weight protein tyrosine phosphatase family protein n=1 Tax=Pontibacter harenae TaxID=2894083 RepID=UPI001E42D408|nr:protein tyrosine phosphatase [Pontibacter harenae]MCC9168348.1 protein tyrosine phosphatase [Pontibacter harenae]
MNILFICSRNKQRSLTAEAIFKNNGLHIVRSAGTEPSARVKVTEKQLYWADVVFVMEKRHKQRLTEKFALATQETEIIMLDIPDDYPYMDAELIQILKASVVPYLGEL